MRTIVTALALLAQTSSLFGQQPAFVVGEKVAGSVGEIQQIPLAGRPVSISLSRDGRLAYSSVQEEDKIYVISISERKIAGFYDTPKGTGPDPVIPLRLGTRTSIQGTHPNMSVCAAAV